MQPLDDWRGRSDCRGAASCGDVAGRRRRRRRRRRPRARARTRASRSWSSRASSASSPPRTAPARPRCCARSRRTCSARRARCRTPGELRDRLRALGPPGAELLRRNGRTAAATASGSSWKGQWPLSREHRDLRARRRTRAGARRSRPRGTGPSPPHTTSAGLRQRGDRRAELGRDLARVGRRAVELQDRPPRRAGRSRRTSCRRTRAAAPSGCPPHRPPPRPARDPCLTELADDRRAPAFGERVPVIAGHHADVDQHDARPRPGCSSPQASPNGPPKSCTTRCTRSIAERAAARPAGTRHRQSRRRRSRTAAALCRSRACRSRRPGRTRRPPPRAPSSRSRSRGCRARTRPPRQRRSARLRAAGARIPPARPRSPGARSCGRPARRPLGAGGRAEPTAAGARRRSVPAPRRSPSRQAFAERHRGRARRRREHHARRSDAAAAERLHACAPRPRRGWPPRTAAARPG